MASSYSTGDVERLLKLKSHVFRYWEQEIPLIQSRKDLRGRRHYSSRDLQIFFRLKYLLYDKHYTIQGARDELYRELSGDKADLMASVSALRNDLLELYFSLQPAPADKTGAAGSLDDLPLFSQVSRDA